MGIEGKPKRRDEKEEDLQDIIKRMEEKHPELKRASSAEDDLERMFGKEKAGKMKFEAKVKDKIDRLKFGDDY